MQLTKKVSGTWVSFNEVIGRGDGEAKGFVVPFPAAEAREILVSRNGIPLAAENRLQVKNERGEFVKDEPDGYKLRVDGEVLTVDFDVPVPAGTQVAVSVLGRKAGAMAFRIRPMDEATTRRIEERRPDSLKKRKRGDDLSRQDFAIFGRIIMDELVEDWVNVDDENGGPAACTSENKRLLMDLVADAALMGIWLTNRAEAVHRERQSGRETDARD